MAEWRKILITNEGLSLNLDFSRRIVFSRVVIGDGLHYTDDGEIRDIDKILNIRQDAEIKEIVALSDKTLQIRAILDNNALAEGYYIREIGIIAIAEDDPEKEILHSIAIAADGRSDYWPKWDGKQVLRISLNMNITVGRPENATAEILNTYNAYEIGFEKNSTDLNAVNVQQAIEQLWKDTERTLISAQQPDSYEWRDGDWWYEDIGDPEPALIDALEIITIPFDESKPFHVEIGGNMETLQNVTDSAESASVDDLVII